jgi:hypothetical protein
MAHTVRRLPAVQRSLRGTYRLVRGCLAAALVVLLLFAAAGSAPHAALAVIVAVALLAVTAIGGHR